MSRATHRWLMLCAALAVCVSAGPAHATFATAFEPAEGYVSGPINGQLGWTGDPSSPADTAIVLSPYSGSASLRITADGLFDGAFHLGASTPAFTPATSRYVAASQEIAIDSMAGADFLVQSADAANGVPAVQMQFTYLGGLIINGEYSGYGWQPEKVMQIVIEHDLLEKTARVLIDGVEVAADVSIDGVSSIDKLQYATDDATTSSAASLYVDNVAVSPEPASAAAIALASLILLRRRQV